MNETETAEQNADTSDTKTSSAAKKYIAELVGTFVLVLVGCGTTVFSGLQVVGIIGISFAFGLPFLAMFYTIGDISGCHINPAVSISMFAAGKLSAKDTVFYIIAQCIGAIIGAAIIYVLVSGNALYSLTGGLGQNGYGTASPAGFSMTAAFIAELILTFIFVLVFHGATSEKAPKSFAGVSIGLSLVFVHLMGIPITGTSVNPARSLGPAVIASIVVDGTALSQLWLFWAAPIIGGLLATVVWKIIN